MRSQALEDAGLPFATPGDAVRRVKFFATLLGADHARLSGGIGLNGIRSVYSAVKVRVWARRAGRQGRDGSGMLQCSILPIELPRHLERLHEECQKR
jgi:hypothetical protein